MAALGIGFAVTTSSDAVLLDGIFSLVGSVVGFIALRVAAIVMMPGDDVFHFGYAVFEPMLNLSKGLLMLFVALFALVSACAVIVDGGREVSAGWVLVYALIASIGCFTIAFLQWRLSKATNSPLLHVDTKNWLLDGVISLAVAVAFLLAMMISNTRFEYLIPYADPSVVFVLVLLSLPIPLKIVRENWNQIVGKAPELPIQQKARLAIEEGLADAAPVKTKIRMQQLGRLNYVQLYVLCDDERKLSLKDLDKCRRAIAVELNEVFDHLALDVIFTNDGKWVSTSIGGANSLGGFPNGDLVDSVKTHSHNDGKTENTEEADPESSTSPDSPP